MILLQLFLLIIPFAFGLFYEFTAYFAQIFLLIVLLFICIKRKKIRIYLNTSSISLLIITIGYLFTCIYAIDKGMALLGFLKFTIPLTFAIIVMQYKQKHMEKMIDVIPLAGVIMIILSLMFRYIPILPDYFYLPNGRMAGFFQYSNTFALFLLIGIITLINSKSNDIKKILITLILLFGILATGSRLVFLLTILNFIIFIVKFKKIRKYLIGLIGIGFIFTIGYVVITNNFNTFGRYLTTSIFSSTLLGRFLYYKDAIPLIITHPFGLGYMGYSYIQTSIQTGVYSTVYVHNDFLQLALDIGIIPTIIFAIAIIKNLLIKNKFDVKKQILLTIILHILFDFDLQFLCIFIILILTLDLTKGKRYVLDINKKIAIILIIFTGIIYLYFAACTTAQYIGKDSFAIKMYPIYTEANLNVIYENAENNIEYANEIATKVIKTNSNIAMPYNVKAIYNLQKENWQAMIKNKQKSLEINKYDIDNYEEYVLMLSDAINYYVQNDYLDKAENTINLVTEVPSKIEKLKQTTSSMAYKIKDKPNFELNDNIQDYIEKMRGVLENE